MTGINRITAAMISLIISALSAAAAAPDFAYPLKVAKNAQRRLDIALKNNDGHAIVRSLIDLELAKSAVANDSTQQIVNRIDTIRLECDNPTTASMLAIVEASVYQAVYQNQMFRFNERTTPISPLPADWNEWTGEQMKQRILTLCQDALQPYESLQATPLKEWADVVPADASTIQRYPSLYDFVAARAIEILNRSVLPRSAFLNMRALVPSGQFIAEASSLSGDSAMQCILTTYAMLLKQHASQPTPFVRVDLERIDFALNHIYQPLYEEASARRVELQRDLYDHMAGSDAVCYVLEAMEVASPSGSLAPWYLTALRDAVSRYPSSSRIPCLTNKINSLTQRTVSVSARGPVIPGRPVELTVQSNNTPQVKILVLRLPDNLLNKSSYKLLKSNLPPITDTLTVDLPGTVPYTAEKHVSVTLDKPGYYAIVSQDAIDNAERGSLNVDILNCSDLKLLSTSFDRSYAITVDASTGAPVRDALITLIDRTGTTPQGSTDADGMLSVTERGNYLTSKGSDKFSPLTWISAGSHSREENAGEWSYGANVLTDLQLYHTGDSVSWVVVATRFTNDGTGKRSVLPNTKCRVIMRNANYTEVADTVLTTDSYGRAKGSFNIPTGELTGRYSISVTVGEERATGSGSCSFTVADYKLPTFHAAVKNVLQADPEPGAITLRGEAMTYSGMPVADARVIASISSSQRYRWFASPVEFATDTVTTDAYGRFSIVLSAAQIATAPWPDGRFTARITVTSTSGESHECSRTFALGQALTISGSVSREMIASKSMRLNLRVIDCEDSVVPSELSYSLLSKDKTPVAQGSLSTPDPTVDWSQIAPGEYTLRTEIKGDSASRCDFPITIYLTDGKISPSENPLWAPSKSTLTADHRGEVSILYATSAKETHVLYTLNDRHRVIERRWIRVNSAGMHTLNVKLPDGEDQVSVSLLACVNNEVSCLRFDVNRSTAPRLSIKAESMRDHLIPGTPETWRFRISVDDKNIEGAMIANMYNAALDALEPASWHFNDFLYDYIRRVNFDWSSPGTYYSSTASRIKYQTCTGLLVPSIDTYGRPWYNTLMLRGTLLRTTSVKMASARASGAVADNMVMMDAVVEEAKDMAANAAPEVTMEGEDGGSSTTPTGQPEFEYRDSETPLAFFYPMLTSSEDGTVDLTFTVPNANASWRFRSVAFTSGLLTARYSADVIANKPVMVQPNLPRFLRQGDTATIRATVMNNTDSAATVTTVVEIFNPSTGEVTSSESFRQEITAQGSVIVSHAITAPVNSALIGYRIKSSTEEFADGEQTAIPVLEAASPVIETIPFYMAPDSTSMTVSLPTMPADADVTLQFCENPAWYVVTALPGLVAGPYRTSPEAASAIFSAAVADGLLKDYPQIGTALREWQHSDGKDSTLVSMLERNQDLKTVLLKATPWMLDARSDTERMGRLALLFNHSNVNSVIAEATAALDRYHKADGGFAWNAYGDQSSSWATMHVLSVLGRLHQLGYLPNDKRLNSMIADAVGFIDNEAVKIYRRDRRAILTDYVTVRNFWRPDYPLNATCTTIFTATMQRLSSGWRKMDVGGKALAANLLYENNYRTIARNIVASMKEYAVSSPTKGMWWPSVGDIYGGSMTPLAVSALALEAFKSTNAGNSDIDAIRQWMILQKETNNWGSSSLTTDVIASFLNASQRWITPAQGASLTVGDHPVEPSAIDRTLGYFRTDISSLDPSGATLTITRNSDTPSWGAIYCRYTADMTDIKPQSCEALSIAKRFYRQDGSQWVETKDFKVGDRVKITLTIRADRDMQYVAVTDERAACFEPVDQMPGTVISQGILFYRESGDSQTNLFVSNLPKGTYMIDYEMWVNNAGQFASGIATAQSQYAPQIEAHSGGTIVTAE